MKLIYVAGKYTGKDYDEIEVNIQHAEKVSVELLRKGWAVLTPHKNYSHYEQYDDLSYETFMSADLTMLTKCDAVIFLKGWETSKGSLIEHKFAGDRNKRIYYEQNCIPEVYQFDGDEKGQGLNALIPK